VTQTTSRLFPRRDIERFYDYPPILGEIAPQAIWGRRALPPRGEINVYVNIPFCIRFCHYCPYAKSRYHPSLVEDHLGALLAEMSLVASRDGLGEAPVRAVYIGGGTPSVLRPPQIRRLLDGLRSHFRLHPATQVNMEFNPATTTLRRLVAAGEAGVTRVSFGVQSFDEEMLRLLGRVHSGDRARRAVAWAADAGFEHVNVDLLYRLPGQTLEQWVADIRTALDLDIDHLTTFGLNIKPHTQFGRVRDTLPPVPGLQLEMEMLDAAESLCGSAGMRRYSIDCFAEEEPNRYETFDREVVGLGAGAFSHVNQVVFHNELDVGRYIRRVAAGDQPVQLGRVLNRREEMERYVSIGIYLLSLSRRRFREKFAADLDTAFPQLQGFVADGLLEDNGSDFRLTRKGLIYVFNISKALFSPEHRELLLFTEGL